MVRCVAPFRCMTRWGACSDRNIGIVAHGLLAAPSTPVPISLRRSSSVVKRQSRVAVQNVCGSIHTGRRRSVSLVRRLSLRRANRMGRRHYCLQTRLLNRSCGSLGPYSCRLRRPPTSLFQWERLISASFIYFFTATSFWIAAVVALKAS